MFSAKILSIINLTPSITSLIKILAPLPDSGEADFVSKQPMSNSTEGSAAAPGKSESQKKKSQPRSQVCEFVDPEKAQVSAFDSFLRFYATAGALSYDKCA